jgi:tripartite-type tricarboxylate transporter receptor subunit TctC
MKFQRRRFLHLVAGAAALPALPRLASALDYPTRPVRIVVPYPAGIAPDIVARVVAQALSQRLKQQFVVDNRPGGASNVGTAIVAHASPDGYTLLVVTTTNAINTSLYDNLDFDLVRDIAPVAGLVRLGLVIVVHPSVPAQTLAEFIAYAKATRWDSLPNVPTAAEFVPGYEAYVWDAVGAPAKTPVEIIEELNKAINAVLLDPTIKVQFASLGAEPMLMTPGELGTYITSEIDKWGQIVKTARIKAD